MKGVIAVNAYSQNEEYLYQAHRMQEEFAKKGIVADIIPNDRFPLIIENGDITSTLDDYDFCIYWDKDKYVLSMLEKIGFPTFNRCRAILQCDDKMLTYIELANQGIPVPKTLPGLLCYREEEQVKPETLDRVETLGYPMVIKESYGSLGQGVYLVHDRNELADVMDKVKCRPHLMQEYVETSYGRDVRVIVIGGQIIGGMLRSGQNDFRSNIGAGGCGQPFELSDRMKTISQKIARILDLDYCGIDLLFGPEGPIVCEVNSNAFFYSFEKTTGINVAAQYVDHVLKTFHVL